MERAEAQAAGKRKASNKRKECAKNFERFARRVLDDESGANDIQPTFDVSEAEEYFVYHSDPHVQKRKSILCTTLIHMCTHHHPGFQMHRNFQYLLMRIHLLWKSCHMEV